MAHFDFTPQELQAYLKCYRNLQPGDKVKFCLNPRGTQFHWKDNGKYAWADVVWIGSESDARYQRCYESGRLERGVVIGRKEESPDYYFATV